MTSPEHEVVFLFDVDDTLLDNDAVKADLGQHVHDSFGEAEEERFWAIYEEQRVKHRYADFLGTLERFRLEHLEDPRALLVSKYLMGYPFAERLYPGALAAVRHVAQWGLPVILTDGDGVFQPYKLERAGLWAAFDGHVLDFVHKQDELGAVARAYPARHYVVIDDKTSVLGAIKRAWGESVTTVFVRQGHYALDTQDTASGPAPDVTLEHVAELKSKEFSALLPA
jgi:beta-phosphoglucomutase-like phosphatase (HAD superfamily)